MSSHTEGNPRLDRIEAIINVRANRHDLIEIEFGRLLNAEDVLAASMKNVTQALEQLAAYHEQMATAHEKRMLNTDERLNALRNTVEFNFVRATRSSRYLKITSVYSAKIALLLLQSRLV